MNRLPIPRVYWKLIWSFTALVAVLVIGTIGYTMLGHGRYSWFDSFYMTFITVTTVGYGEIIDMSHNPTARVFTVFIGTAGLGCLWFMFSTLTVIILEGDLNKELQRRRMEKSIKKLSDHYIICGFGRVGHNVAKELEATRRAYVAVDEDLAMLEEQKEKNQELLYLHGDASDDDLLLRANIEAAKGVFAITGDDSHNLMIALTAKQLNHKVRVVARCHEIRNMEKIRKAGAEAIVSPDFTGGMRIVSAMVRPQVMSFLDEMLRTEHQLRVEEFTVPVHSSPKTLGEMRPRSSEYIILAIRRHGEWLFNPDDDFLLELDDILIVITSPQGRYSIDALLKK